MLTLMWTLGRRRTACLLGRVRNYTILAEVLQMSRDERETDMDEDAYVEKVAISLEHKDSMIGIGTQRGNVRNTLHFILYNEKP